MGAISILAIYPDQHLVVAITDNSDHSLNALATRLASWFTAGGKAVTR